MAKQFNIKGKVLGNLWMGGTGAYPMQNISAPTRKKAMDMAKKRLDMSKLTGTGDFDGEIGAVLYIECITTRTIGGKVFTNVDRECLEFLGKLTDKQQLFLLECEF